MTEATISSSDEEVDSVDKPSISTRHERASRNGLRWWMVLGVAVVVAGGRWWLSRHRVVLQFRSDESGQLGMSRIISGGTTWNMLSNVTWRPGYAVLIAPFHWAFSDPTQFYRSAIVTNAILGGVAAALLVLVTSRLVTVPATWNCVFALVASLFPGVVLMTNWIWAESLVVVVTLATLLAALVFVEHSTAARGVAVIGLASFGFMTHGRLGGLVVSAVGLVLWAGWQRRISRSAVLCLIAAAGVGVALTEWLTSWLVGRMYTRPLATNTVGRVVGNLADPVDVMISLAGQIWYQFVATFALSIVGAVALLRTALSRSVDRRSRQAAVTTCVMLVPMIGTAAVFLSDTPQQRADYIVYGRYLDAMCGPLVVVGLALVFFGSRRDRLLTLAIAATTGVVTASLLAATREAALQNGRLVRHMVIGILGLIPRSGDIDLVRVTAIGIALSFGLGLLAGLASASSRPWVGRVVVMLLFVAVLGVVGRNANAELQPRLNRLLGARAVEQVRDGILPTDASYLFDLRDNVGERRMAYQFYLPSNRLYALSNRSIRPPTPYVFASVDDVEILDLGGQVLWTDPDVPLSLYLVPAWEPER